MFPAWRSLAIHESSPVDRGISAQLKRECAGYVLTQYFPGQELGAMVNGVRNEDLERQTFPDASFDIVVSQDVMEHVNDFPKALIDIHRTLKPGGAHIFTTPTYPAHHTLQWATYVNGKIKWLYEPEYHGNPVDAEGSPVTFHYGYDFPELIYRHCGLATEIIRLHDPHQGIEGTMNEVYVIKK
jgi:SAM-dependent methyltransferase